MKSSNVITIIVVLLLTAGAILLNHKLTPGELPSLAISIICLVILYFVLKGSSRDFSASVWVEKLRIKENSRLMMLVAFLFLILSFAWLPVAMHFVDHNTLTGALIVFVPAISCALISGFYVIRLFIHILGGWMNGSE